MDTAHFLPTEDYIARCIDVTGVRRFLETSHYRKSLYIITGVKIVSGAQGATTSSRAAESVVSTQVDGTILSGGMVPVGGGPGIKGRKEIKHAVSWKGSTDFVFAFKVSEVRVSKLGEVKRERDYTKGALFEDRTEKDKVNPLAVSVVDASALELQDDFISEAVEEGDAVVTYGVLMLNENLD